MESFSKETEAYTEDIPGKKKSKLKNLKTRLFGKTKKVDIGRSPKLSQSASDITPEEDLGSEEDLVCSQGILGSRALSHDSIFMADDVLPEPQLANAQSQENVHSKIKALQMKLQQQKMHLGPPPAVVPIRHAEDLGGRSEDDDGLPHSPSETLVGDIITTGTASKVTSQITSRQLPPIPKASLIKPVPVIPSLPAAPPASAAPSMDFSSPAQFTPCLDTSAARHRMSVKPRNQRASAKGKRLAAMSEPATDCKPLNNTHHVSMSEKDEEQQPAAHNEVVQLPADAAQVLEKEKEQITTVASSQSPPSKSIEPLPITPSPVDPQEPPKPLPTRLTQQDRGVAVTARVSTQPLADKPQRPADALAGTQSQSSPVHPDKQDQNVVPGDFETQASSNGPVSCPNDQTSAGLTSMGASRSFFARQQVQSQRDVPSTKGVLQRPVPGSGSFRFSGIAAKGQVGERPGSGSVSGVLEQDRARLKIGDGAEFKLSPSNMNQREKELQKVGSTAVGTPLQGEAQCKEPMSQDRKDSVIKGEPVMPLKQIAVDAGAVEKEDVKAREESVENTVEAKDDPEGEGKTAFGVTLRSTSLSLKFRADVASTPSDSRFKRHSAEMGSLAPPNVPYNRPTKSALSDQHHGNSKERVNLGDNDSPASAKLSTNNPYTPGSLRQTDGIPYQTGPSTLPVKCIQTPAADPPVIPAVTSEAQTILSKPKEDAETLPQSSPEVSWMSMAMEKTRSFQQLLTSRLPRDFTSTQATSQPQEKPTNQAQTVTQSQAPNATQVQTATVKEQYYSPQPQAPVQSSLTQSTPSSQPPPTRNNPGLRPAIQPRSLTSAQALVSSYSPSTTAAPASVPPVGRGERSTVFQGKGEGPSERRADLAVSVGERAAFLQKQTEFTAPSVNKVELRKPQTEARTPAKSLPIPITTTSNKDTEGKPGERLQESSPSKVPGRLADHEEKWLRKQIAPPSMPSSSPLQSSPLQSMSNSGQPSWMEMAKRKSMAWSDKSMD